MIHDRKILTAEMSFAVKKMYTKKRLFVESVIYHHFFPAVSFMIITTQENY